MTQMFQDQRCAPVCGVMGPNMACTWIRGEIEFLMDLAGDDAFCRDLIGRMCGFLTGLGLRLLEVTDTWDTAIWVYDEFSIMTGPFISPATFERLFLEPYRRVFRIWKDAGARHIVLHHDILSPKCYPIVDMYLDAGLTGVQGVYPTAGLGVAEAGRDGGVLIGSHSIEGYIAVASCDHYAAVLDAIEARW